MAMKESSDFKENWDTESYRCIETKQCSTENEKREKNTANRYKKLYIQKH